ncbi:Protein kinase domain-containing protein ppk32 [Savitreella phatthalungensis]
MLSSIKSFAASATTGSAIKSAYVIDADSGFTAGPWLCQDAVKKSTKQEVSVLTFSKRSFEQAASMARGLSDTRGSSSASLRQAQDAVVQQLKQEAATLARLRHPAMLEVVESVEETRNSLIFVTERVTGCLASMVEGYDDSADSFNQQRRHRSSSDRLDEIEIQKGLLQVTIGLEFLQNIAKMVHGNLVPDAVLINAKGDWKLAGFSFAVPQNKEANPAGSSMTRFDAPDFDPRLPRSVQRNLDFAAPESVLDEQVDPLNDMYSLGCLVCALVSQKRRSPIDCNQNLHLYRKQADSLNVHNLQGVPPYLRDVIPQLLTRRPAHRLSAQAFATSPFFDNILMNSIRFLDAFPEKTASERQSFMRGLGSVIPQFPPRVLTKKILPGLMDQFQDHALLPLTLPNIFIICEAMPQKVFSESVLPRLKPIFILEDAPRAQHYLLEKLPIIKTKVTALELKEDVMPLVYVSLASTTPYLCEVAVAQASDLVKDLDLVTVKTALFPKIADTFAKTTMLSVKVACLKTFCVMVSSPQTALDKFTITEKLIPLLKAVKTKEPDVSMAILDLCAAMAGSKADRLDSETLALEVLPILWTFALGSLLNKLQFGRFATLIKQLTSNVADAQATKLQDGPASSLSSNGVRGSGGDLLTDDQGASSGNNPPQEMSFEKLVLGGKPQTSQTYSQQPSTATSAAGNGLSGLSFGQTTTTSAGSRPPAQPSANTNSATRAPFSWSTPAPAPAPALAPTTTGMSALSFSQPPLRPTPPQKTSSFTQMQNTGSTRPNYNIDTSAVYNNGFSIAPPPTTNPTTTAWQSSSTNIPPPPTTNFQQPAGSVRPQSAQKKSGLDAYASLL